VGLYDFIKDKADDALGAIPDIPFALGAKPVRLDPANIVKQPLRPVIATTNLFRGIGGTVGVVTKNLTYDLFIQQGFALNGRTGFWEDPLAAVIEFAQQDMMRDVLGLPMEGVEGTGSGYGLFAPKGIGGGIFGAFPSEIRNVTRPAISQGVEGLHYVFNNGVDNPLSMIFTMVNRVQDDLNGNPLNLFNFESYDRVFDINEWKQAYDIAYNQERSAGGALGAGLYGIDPFDQEAYNAIKTNDLFVIISGTADLYKEWKDPIERAVRVGTNVARGETAIVKINDQGDIVRQYRFGLPYTPVRQAMPDKIWVVEDGVTMPRKIAYDKDITTSAIQRPADMTAPQGMVSKVKDKFNKVNNITEQDLALRKTVTTETAKGMSTSRWFESTWEAVTGGRLDDINFSASYRNNGVATKADRALVAERAATWRQAAGRKNGTKLPERVQYALATAPSRPAAQRILREYMGDMTVKGEIDSVIKKGGELLDSDYGLKIKKLDDNDRLITRIQKSITKSDAKLKSLRAQKLKLEEARELISTKITPIELRDARRLTEDGLESAEAATKRLIANRRRNNTKKQNEIKKELDTLVAQRQKEAVKIAGVKSENAKLELEVAAQGKILKEVHWDYHFDITNQIKSSQQKKVTLDANGDVVLPESQLKQWGDAERVTAQIIADDILSGALLADGIVKSVGSRKIYQPVGVVHRLALDKIRRTDSETVVSTYNKHGKKYSYGYENPQVFTPLGAKFLRVITSRVPQGLIHFTDMGGQSSIMFERIIEDASQFRLNGKQILSEAEANQIMATWQRYVYEGADYSQFAQYYGDIMNTLIHKAENLMREEGIQVYNDAGKLVDVPDSFLVKQLNGAQANFLDQLDQNHFKVIDMKETKLTVDEGIGEGRPRGEAVTRNGEVVEDRGAYGSNQQTYLANPAVDGIDIYTYNLNLAQLGECSVCPRFDLLQREIERSFNKTDYFGSGKRGTQKQGAVQDFKRRAIPNAVTLGRGLQEVWTSGKLLSPRWTARVLTDEKLRAAAVIGLLPMLATIQKGFNKYVRNMQARGLNMTDDDFAAALREEIASRSKIEIDADATLVDIAKVLDEANMNVDEIMDATATRSVDNARVAQKKESGAKFSKYGVNQGIGATARVLVGGIINPLIGAGWGFRYYKNRTKNLQDYAVKSSARQLANGFQTEAARIIAEAAGDPDVLELASRLSSSGDQLLRDIKYLEDNYNFGMNWADKSKVVSLFDQADMWWDKAGYPRQTIGNATFGNAWGSDIRFQRLAEKQLSSANSLDTAMRGPVAAAKREVVNNMPETWEVVDILQKSVGSSRMVNAWTRTFMQMSRTGTKEIQFYDIMYNDALTHAQKVTAISALIENTPRLRRKFEIKSHEGKGADRTIFDRVAEDAINEVNDFLPPEYFPDLRAKVRAGEEISWNDVENILLDKDFKKTHGFKGADVKEVVAEIREKDGRVRNGFGKARDSFAQPQDMGQIRKWLRDKADKAFANLGTSAADDISRGPFFEARYRKHLIDNTAPYVKADGTYDLTPKDVIRMEEEARKAAFKDTREVLYELAEHSELAEMVGFMSPFFNAWQEVIGRWAGLALENPAFAYKGVRLFTKEDLELPILGITQEEDQFGNVNLVFRPSNSGLASFLTNPKFTHAISDAANRVLPSAPIGSVGKLADEIGINLDKDGLFTMLTKTSPSAGPFITLPIRTFMFDLKKPEVEGLVGWMFPFGHPDGNIVERAIQEFAPAWAGHAWYKALKPNERMGLGNTQNYGLTMISMVQYLDAKAREAGTPYDYSDPEVMDAVIKKAEEMTTSIGYLKFLASSVIPVATNASTPYGPQITRLSELQDQARLIGESNEWAVKVFLAEHGEEFFFLTGNATRNAKGVAPTIESFKLSQKHEDFIRKYPALTAVVTDSLRSSIIEDASFSPAVHQMYMNEGWREVYTPEEFIKQTEIQRGYVELNAWKDTPLTEGGPSYNALLNARDGLSNSPNTNVHAELKRLYDQEKERLSVKYPLFGEALNEFSTSSYVTDVIEAARALVEDPDLAYKPWVGSLVEYLDQRDDMQRRLETVPNPDIEAGENLLLRLEWEDIRWNEFATRPDFALFFTRYLENDLIPETSWID